MSDKPTLKLLDERVALLEEQFSNFQDTVDEKVNISVGKYKRLIQSTQYAIRAFVEKTEKDHKEELTKQSNLSLFIIFVALIAMFSVLTAVASSLIDARINTKQVIPNGTCMRSHFTLFGVIPVFEQATCIP
jgi:uncharacterized coiled-coil protein SlyX